MQVNINKGAVLAKVEGAFKKGLPILTEEIKDDCNQYCKWDIGDLAMSANRHSIPEEGLIIWQTSYAKRQYWQIKTAYKDKQPKATWKWCEVAKAELMEKWQRQAQRLMEMNL